ncbi:transcriptional regulatory protein TcrA [Clostridium puniceum]|uniref:Stage 0 sporulation protein A homolog n=1 Tax=Clostridium puniceum TaxID=29367 RepID=A0A1S8TC22_9CLOT|nr:response regulator transcription factor [Clostridium puniceum]OOM75357.1 transcriptional regulatory protein TcrA [Clostridium puniceum]
MRILIVDDEVRLAEALGQIVTQNKYIADIVNDGESGYDYAMSGIYDVIILDVMLPGMNGFDIVGKMRENKENTPVILLTAKDEVTDKVTGLDCGADDYLTKPFSPEELLARVRALSRRQGELVSNELKFGDLILNQSANTLFCGAKSVRLGLKEFEILRLLMSNQSSIVTKEDLLLKVWGADSNAEDNNVEVYISFLRKKFFFLGSIVTIETLRKIGYHLGENLND